MKTLVDISESTLHEARQLGNFETKKDTIQGALEFFIRQHKVNDLAEQLGSFTDFAPSKSKQREKRSTRIFCLD